MKIMKTLSALLVVTSASFAVGPHSDITCLGCHSIHFAMDNKIFAVKNTHMINPRNGKSLKELVASKCLGCHELEQFGGAGVKPIHLHTTHPIGIVPDPAIADVPANLLNNGQLDCVSCHEPHPSNQNFMYLRVATDGGKKVQNFCVACHSAKGDMKLIGFEDTKTIQLFSAMNQANGAVDYNRDDMIMRNETPDYVRPLGAIPKNDITPNYLTQPSWVYSPEIDPTTSVAKPTNTNPGM